MKTLPAYKDCHCFPHCLDSLECGKCRYYPACRRAYHAGARAAHVDPHQGGVRRWEAKKERKAPTP